MNSSPLQIFLRKPLITLQTASMHFLLSRSLILIMAALQLIWLALIVMTGASTKYQTILVVAIFSVMATLCMVFLPTSAIQKISQLKDWLFRSEKRSLLFLCLAALIIGFLYASVQNAGADEQSSLTAANIIATEGLSSAYTALGRVGWLGQQHPPLFPIIFSLALRLPGPDLFAMRLVSVLFLAGTLVATYLLGRELYSREIGYLAALLMLSFPLVIRLSAAAMMDIQLVFFFSLALLLSIRLSRNPSYRLACATGLVIGLGLLTKYIMIFTFVVLFVYVLFFKSFQRIKIQLLLVAAVSLSVFAIWLLYANHIGILSRQFEKILNFVGSYHVIRNLEESSQETPSTQLVTNEAESPDPRDLMQNGIFRLGLESLFTRIPSSLGVYHAPLILFGLLYLLKRRQSVDLMLLLWIGAVSLSLFLTLPDHRYFLPVFPAIAIAIAQMLFRFPDYAGRATLLSLLLGMSSLYLFANWFRESHLFLLAP
jgi:4-amino-4-deoxy-L-arabinose transferase-like glycosyltransferase